MKIRKGFVSNSSSSSFILAIKEEECKCCGRGKDTLNNIFSLVNSSYSDQSIIAENIKEVMCAYTDNKEMKDYINKAKELSKKGYTIIAVEISNHNSVLQHLIHIDKNIIVIKDEEY